jgi:hypothetical protein
VATDDRLRDALRSTAQEPSLEGVAERVHAKRARRRTVRRLEALGTVAVVAAAVTVGSVALLEEDRREISVPPAAARSVAVRVAAGLDLGARQREVKVTRVRLEPDEGYVRGPLLVTGNELILAAYDRDGSTYKFPPSRIVRVRADGTVVDRVDLQGEIQSLDDGEGARWALTRDKTVIGPEDPEFRVKRIGPDGTVASNAVPPGEQPVGDIVAEGGGVWVPVLDGVLRFDVASGEFAAKIPLEGPALHRVVPLGKFVGVTDGHAIKRLDPNTDRAFETDTVVLDELDDGADITGLAAAAGGGAAVAWSQEFDEIAVSLFELGSTQPLDQRLDELRGEVPQSLFVVDDTVWVWVNSNPGRRALVKLAITPDGLEPIQTAFVTARGSEVDHLAVAPDNTVFFTIDGQLYRVRLPT